MANYVRCILFSNENGSREGVIFTEDMDTITQDFIPPGCKLDGESEFPISYLPNSTSFPLDYILWKES